MTQKAWYITGFVAVCLLSVMQLATAQVPTCSEQPIPNFQKCCTSTEVLYLLDWSDSISDDPNDKVAILEFLKRSRCMFHETATKAGLIVFNNQVQVAIPFAHLNSTEWYTAVDNAAPLLLAQKKYTPMAEALWKAGQVFNETGNPPCGMNRLVILLSDGRPYQNMPAKPGANYPQPYLGTDIPTTWLYSEPGMTSAIYAEQIVPAQAKNLKDNYDARIIVVALKSGSGVLDNARIDYFKGIITPQFQCNTNTPNCNGGLTCTTGVCTGLTKAISQCYLRRVTTVTGYGDATSATNYPYCINRDASYGFPIAYDTDHVVKIQNVGSLLDQAINGTGPLACPKQHLCASRR